MQQLRNDYSLTFPPLSIARYSCIQLSRLRRREVKENAQTSKRYLSGFEPGLSRLRVRHSTAEPPRSTRHNMEFSFFLFNFAPMGRCKMIHVPMPVSRTRSSPVPEVVTGSGTMHISKIIMDAISMFIHITHE